MSTTSTIPAVLESCDPRFDRYGGDSVVEKIHLGCRWAEGPVYVPAGRYVLVNDIPNDRTLRWDERTGDVTVVREPAGYANGQTLDRIGRLVVCQQGPRCVSRLEHDGSWTVLTSEHEGRRLNSPNDAVVRSDDSIWFTDPSYGIDTVYEGHPAPSELDGCHVYRLDPATGDLAVVADDFERPNGLAFSADESTLYVADTRRNHIRRLAVTGDDLATGEVMYTNDSGVLDGIRLDALGRIWAATGDGVHCIDPDGTLLGKLVLPEPVSNLVFGGLKRNRLFVTATTSLYSIMLNVAGAPPVWATPAPRTDTAIRRSTSASPPAV
ncbi:SMP-30/gluconolactonase/LRE family protein [Desertimonas flava]|uniref:SMP-30/gluconolactonase/LRE family protein n=1 Tax=Desertimonas flava TaxID=2064846 RepID=UPI000E353F12|nr:SMP-30/gluconolactonase/LRE family protein [Desertimonas flava]